MALKVQQNANEQPSTGSPRMHHSRNSLSPKIGMGKTLQHHLTQSDITGDSQS